MVSDEQQTVIISGYTGGSVELPCSCADPQSTATTFTWEFEKGNRWIKVSEDEKYSGRHVLFFNVHCPTNPSLLITDIRMNDEGYYKCLTEPNTFVFLQVKGCDFVENRQTVAVTGYSGESVVLPCSCTELLAKPEQIQWMYFSGNKYKEIYPNEQIGSHKKRVKLLNPNTPGDLSLRISALTTEDQGDYQCYVSSQQVVSFRLTVLHVKGCMVSDVQQTVRITGYTGGSVVLPCSCADPQSTATTFTWEFEHGNGWIQVSEDKKYSGRCALFNERSPTNLSLLITDLRMNDQGYYKCLTEPNIITFVHLEVKGCDFVENRQTVEVSGYSGESVVLPCSCTELLAKPEQIQWMYLIENQYKEIYPTEQIESHKNRVKLLNPNTPGNLSLHISALTTEDQGGYQCVSFQQVVGFRLAVLHVEEPPHVHTISLPTHQPSHQTQDSTNSQRKLTPQQNLPQNVFILLGVFFLVLLLTLLAFICWRCRGGRNDKKVTTDGEVLKREQDNQ
ncbi:hypothetical protein QQF64_016924, partial [Cirrhinus molitorella]